MQIAMQVYDRGEWRGSVIPEPRYPEDAAPRVRARRKGYRADRLFIGPNAQRQAYRYVKGELRSWTEHWHA